MQQDYENLTYCNLGNIPAELKPFQNWVLWKPLYNKEKGKADKIPINPNNYSFAKANDPSTWTTFDRAVSKRKTGYGLGIELTEDMGIVGIDFDKCVKAGIIEPWAQELINKFNSYTEISPSGTGIRIFVKAILPPGGNRRGQIEFYSSGRFLTVTGNHLEGTPLTIEPRQDELNAIHRGIFTEPEKPVANLPQVIPSLTDAEIIKKAQNSRNGAKFTRLYNGDTSDYGGDDSRADQALCSMLAFWTSNNAHQMDCIFRTSGLYREKWDKKHGQQTYGEMTISRAIKGNKDTYKAPERKQGAKKEGAVTKINPTPTGKFSFTDLGNSERLISKFGIDLRYCHEFKKWFIWNGKQWREDNQGRIYYLATQTVRAMIEEAKDLPDDERLALIRWSLKSESRDKIKAMVDLAQNHPQAVVSYSQFDQNHWLLNLRNGTLNLKDGKLQPHRREDYISKISPVEYDSAATSPIWERFINEIMDNKLDLIKYLQKLAGHSLTGDVSEQDLYICHGTGGNGKSVFLNTIMAMLGPDYTKQTSATALLVKQNETCGEEIAVLAGARFVATLETEDGKRLAESLVKQLVGGDKIRARFLYGNSFEFQPCLKLWMATNHKPKVTGMDVGIWRRIKLLPFTVSIPEEKQDRQLPEKLKAELPGILNWCVEGCLQWQREGLTPPAEVETATSEYKSEMDTIGTFLINNCQTGPDFKSTSKGLYEIYVKWCEDGGERPLSQRKLGSRLRERGFISHVGTGNRTYWKGLGIKAADYQDMDTGGQWQGMGKIVNYPYT